MLFFVFVGLAIFYGGILSKRSPNADNNSSSMNRIHGVLSIPGIIGWIIRVYLIKTTKKSKLVKKVMVLKEAL
ncbi:hypothetical protein DFP94_10274 [Fontibacillus phaseoli]|uniref:Uncharacterized protein n=1 Tax=Fontibacillus phaseoli TaxID=1416533 RepID=A0A369BL35_9BACL|nr:hypothetical protein DFP94_10274 [Fontibacillus phaseoli]